MLLTLKVKSFLVKSDNEKEAYIDGCKKYAKYIASSKYKNLMLKVDRTSVKGEFVFTIFTNVELSGDQKNFCKMCKEIHSSFFVNEEYNCNRCNLKTFLLREEQKLRISKQFYKEKMNGG